MKRAISIISVVFLFSVLSIFSTSAFNDSGNFNLALVGIADNEVAPIPSFSIATTSLYNISAEGYLLVATTPDGLSIVAEKNINQKFYLASITKLMTVVIIYENLSLTTPIQIDVEDINKNSSSGLFKAGNVMYASELLLSMLVESNNDAGWALARALGTSKFINLMNEKSQELGMTNTHFENPVGLDPMENRDAGNVSTPKDLLILTNYILKNYPEIFSITRSETRPIVDFRGYFHHVSTSTNQLLSDRDFPYIILGGKTGQTPLANKNLLLIYRDPNLSNIIFISIVLNSKNQFEDSLNMARALQIH
ncbi:MAG: serine hydrolase [bacterium]|nr:serine hydrolase [bacterium]